jgi:hypothetical protein
MGLDKTVIFRYSDIDVGMKLGQIASAPTREESNGDMGISSHFGCMVHLE